VAHNISIRLEDDECNGDISQCLIKKVGLYQRVATDYELSLTQKLKYLHNILDGEALRYCSNVSGSCDAG
jgi:hypothetical protein